MTVEKNFRLDKPDKFVIFIIASIVRAGYVLAQYYLNPLNGGFSGADTAFYLEISKNLLAGNGLAHQGGLTAYVSPLFPIFLAGCLRLFGDNLIWVSLFQCLLSATVCVFIASIASIMFGRRVGFTAGMIAALYYELIFWTSGQILSEPLYTVFLAAAVCSLTAAATTGSGKSQNLKYALAGILFGLAGLVRPLALLIAIGLGLSVLLISFWQDKKIIKPILIFIAACLLTMQPWGIRNYLVLDHYTLTSTEGGHVFWLGNNPEYDLYEHPDFTQFAGYTAMFAPPPEMRSQLNGQTEVESNRLYEHFAWEHIYQHPALFFVRALHKTWNMWRPTFGGASFRNKTVSYTIYPLLLLFSLIGILLSWKLLLSGSDKFRFFLFALTRPIGLLSLFLFGHLLIHGAVTGEIRFRVPLWIALIPFASLTVISLFERIAGLRIKSHEIKIVSAPG